MPACYTGGIRSSGHAAATVAAAVAVCLAVAVAACAAAGPGGATRPRSRPSHISSARRPSARPASVAPRPRQLAADLNLAERIIHSRRSSPHAVARAALLEELATGVLERERAHARRATLAAADAQASASMRTDLAAAAALSGLAEHRRRLPPWRIIAPPPGVRLLRFFHAAQARSHVPWQYLAAIELVETRFGRIRGRSSAGAQGPMQFMRATWARYGRGSVNNPRDAIFAAARLLAANGAPHDMGDALLHYNDSPDYVAAVRAYARHMQRDPRSYNGYYAWQVIYAYDHRTVILPVGFPARRPVPLPSARDLPALAASLR